MIQRFDSAVCAFITFLLLIPTLLLNVVIGIIPLLLIRRYQRLVTIPEHALYVAKMELIENEEYDGLVCEELSYRTDVTTGLLDMLGVLLFLPVISLQQSNEAFFFKAFGPAFEQSAWNKHYQAFWGKLAKKLFPTT